MKAIVTKYFGPSHTKGSRIRVSAEGVKSRTYSYDHGASDAFRTAAENFCRANDWHGRLVERRTAERRSRLRVR